MHEKTLQKVKTDKILKMSVHCLYFAFLGKISVQPHTTLCIQFLDRENNEKNNRLPLGKQICFTIVGAVRKFYPFLLQLCNCVTWECTHFQPIWCAFFFYVYYRLNPNWYFSLFSSLIWLILYWYCKEKFSLGHSREFKG